MKHLMTDVLNPPFILNNIFSNSGDFNAFLIEASAGTGKTYTMTYVILELIARGLSLEEIVAITFTEKAAYELKTRVRKLIQEKVCELKNAEKTDHSLLSKFIQALENFNKNKISTIHSFSFSVLNEYPLYTGLNIQPELVSDNMIFEEVFNETIKSDFLREDNQEFLKLLEFQYSGNYKKLKKEFAKIYKLGGIKKFKVNNLIPALQNLDEFLDEERIEKLESNCFIKYMKEKKSVGEMIKWLHHLGECIEEIKQIPQKEEKKRVLQLLKNIKKNTGLTIEKIQKGTERLLSPLIDSDKKKDSENTLQKKAKTRKKLAEFLDTDFFETFRKFFNEIYYFVNFQRALLLSLFYGEFEENIKRFKNENNYITYDDQIVYLKSAMADSAALCEILQKKYKALLIDEFQDTDNNQWEIAKSLFLNEDGSFINADAGRYLFLIGDPKQSIYRFRGADIYVYNEAKEFIRNKRPQNISQLDVNYRTSEKMLDGLSKLFDYRPIKFFGEDIDFVKIKADNNKKMVLLTPDGSEVKPIKAIGAKSFENEENIPKFEEKKVKVPKDISSTEHFYNRVASEIKTLVSSGYRFSITENGKTHKRKVRYEDIYILGRMNRSLELIGRKLHKLGVPHIFHKKEGLFQGEETENLYTLLKAVQAPYNRIWRIKALLTDFFGYKASDIPYLQSLAENDVHFRQLLEWHKLATKGKLVKVLNQVFLDSGVLERAFNDVSRKNLYENYMTIWEILLEELSKKWLNLDSFLLYLYQLFQDNDQSKVKVDKLSDNYERSTIGINAVKLLTIHKSKGLEAPIVFYLDDGFISCPGKNDIIKFRDKTDGSLKNIPFRMMNEEQLEEYYKEEKEEASRLLYVAATRAKSRFYLGLQESQLVKNNEIIKKPEEFNKHKIGEYEAYYNSGGGIFENIERDDFTPDNEEFCFPQFSFSFLMQLLYLDYLYEYFGNYSKKELAECFDFEFKTDDYAFLEFKRLKSLTQQKKQENIKRVFGKNLAAKELDYSDGASFKESRSTHIHLSYSSLKLGMTSVESNEKEEYLKKQERIFAELFEFSAEDIEEPVSEDGKTLRGGAATGNFLHEILELIPIETFNNSDFSTWKSKQIISQIINEKFIEHNMNLILIEHVKKIVWNAFTLNIGTDKTPFSICDAEKHYSEMEFLFEENRREICKKLPQLGIDPEGRKSALFKGFIDLTFRWEGKYYILDWKSDRADDYSSESIANKVTKNYYIQELLYTYFICRRLQIDNKAKYDNNFGGMYYIYLRGLQENSKDGIYYNRIPWKILKLALES